MSKSPNAEQKLAIEHNGGVILRAGAGSGKTFVLVEHIVHLTQSWILEFKAKPLLTFEEFIRQKFSQVVMMTFTKKAAGEMSIRLTEKFKEIVETSTEDMSFWQSANENLPMLMVTTIDGFCRKLITAGYFPYLSTEAKIIFSPERTEQVKALVETWLLESSHNRPQEMIDIVLREKADLLSAFNDVFSDPGLRLAWKSFDSSEAHPKNLGSLLARSFDLNDLSSALQKIHQLDLPEDSGRSAFEKFVGEVQSSGLPVVDSVEKLQNYWKFFDGKTLRGEAGKKKSPSHDLAKDGLSDLRDWIKKWKDVISDYVTHYESKVKPWINLCQELFIYIDQRLDPNQGMTFGDIEYFVYLGLQNRSDLERIQKAYSYFIVDEFQDTSALQFHIIQNLIGGNYNRLFCVGDAKQAIYGFRGGELSVFQDCSDLMPQVLSLANNYRSLPEIIEFNNSLFQTILPLGQEFQGHDPFSVVPEDQNVPLEVVREEPGEIEILSGELTRDIEIDGKFSNEDINRLEAILLGKSIADERELHPERVCTILYSKLKPSGELIRILMNQKIGFTAQFKIDLLDDPVMGIFLSLIRRKFDKNEKSRDLYPLFVIKSYLANLGVESHLQAPDLDKFDQDAKYWGLLPAFMKFLHKLQMTNENSDINLQVIETMANLYNQDPENMMVQLLQGDNQRLSLELRSGENSHRVQIMSAHASKGLEFDVVYLGGIYTNGKEMNDGSLFGSLPGSFNWYIDLSQRQKQKSPQYVFENELSKYKNFSEAKRLFYVACTRAKKKLVWVDFAIQEKTFSVPKNSWSDGLKHWFNDGLFSPLKNVKVTELIGFDPNALLNEKSLPQLPLYFHDSVGIFPKQGSTGELSLLPELSVTRLNSLVDCPRKFYMESVLKITPSKDVTIYRTDTSEESDELADVVSSNAERGTSIHAFISKGLERNFIVPREAFDKPEKEPIEWALGLLKELSQEFTLVSEKQVKFKFFNFMISGIPDLILLPKGDQCAQVWDFKTGRITQENLKHYWLQLSIYAYALFLLEKIPRVSEVELVLCFVDQKKNLTMRTNFSQVVSDLYPVWKSQNEPWKINPDHCSQCSYGDICLR